MKRLILLLIAITFALQGNAFHFLGVTFWNDVEDAGKKLTKMGFVYSEEDKGYIGKYCGIPCLLLFEYNQRNHLYGFCLYTASLSKEAIETNFEKIDEKVKVEHKLTTENENYRFYSSYYTTIKIFKVQLDKENNIHYMKIYYENNPEYVEEWQ